MVKDSDVYARRAGIVWREEEEAARDVRAALEEGRDAGDEGTLILVDSGHVFELNLLGAEVWKLCDGSRTVGDVVGELLGGYDVGRGELVKDVQDFLEEMSERGWMVKS